MMDNILSSRNRFTRLNRDFAVSQAKVALDFSSFIFSSFVIEFWKFIFQFYENRSEGNKIVFGSRESRNRNLDFGNERRRKNKEKKQKKKTLN